MSGSVSRAVDKYGQTIDFLLTEHRDKDAALRFLKKDVLPALGSVEDSQQQMSDAEVMTTALVARLFFRGNFEAARALLSTPR
jgi:hypothetical protein